MLETYMIHIRYKWVSLINLGEQKRKLKLA